MGTRSIVAGIFFLALIFPLPAFVGGVQADSPPLEGSDSTFDGWLKKAGEGVEGPVAGTHYYWDEGFHVVSRGKNLKLKIGGKIILDGGYIDADKELERAFPDLKGYGGDFRSLSVTASGTIRALSAVKERAETIKKPVPPGRMLSRPMPHMMPWNSSLRLTLPTSAK